MGRSPRRSKSAPETTSEKADALVPSADEGQSVAFRLERLSDPIDQLFIDAQDAQSTWRITQPLAARVIELLRHEVENASHEGEIGLAQAQKLLTTITQAAKALAGASQTIHGTLERIVELQRTIGGGSRDLSKLSEGELRKIILGVADSLRRPLVQIDGGSSAANAALV